MKFGKARFYADENIESSLVEYLRDRGYKVYYAPELGLNSRDDSFQLAEARRRKCILLTKDIHFLNNRKYPFSNLGKTSIVVLGTEMAVDANYGYLLLALVNEIGPSGISGLVGLKIEIKGPILKLQARIGGKIKTDFYDIRKPEERDLFAEEPERA